jgi:hypothetical protein
MGDTTRLVWGTVIAGLYVAVMMFSSPGARHLLYDGLAPLLPYRWVSPPAGASKDPPATGSGTIALGPRGSEASEISTTDDQALVTFPAGVIALRPGESSVNVTISPLDPGLLAAAPVGRRFDGNAYRVSASYASSAAPAALVAVVTVVLRYPIHATQVLRLEGGAWTALQSTRFDGSQQVLANTDRLGTFTAAP